MFIKINTNHRSKNEMTNNYGSQRTTIIFKFDCVNKGLNRDLLFIFILFYVYIYPPDSLESDEGANT